MKFLKALLLSSFVASGAVLSVSGMGQQPLTPQMIQNDANAFFSYLNDFDKINFIQSDKGIVVRLFSACQDNNISEINKVVTVLKKKNNANELVCVTLFFATYNCSDIVAQNLLNKKPLRAFIFRAFLPDDQTKALHLLQETVDCCVQVGHFDVLTVFINQILLTTSENDKYHELPQGWNASFVSDFVVDDCEKSFKNALKISKERNYNNLLSYLGRLHVTLDESDSDSKTDEDTSGSSSDQEDDDSADCSSDKDSDGECSHTRGANDLSEYLYEHMDQMNI